MIQVGEQLPQAALSEFNAVETAGCALGPVSFDVRAASANKTIAIFAVPGAFTPTCSEKHLPGYLSHAADFRAAGVDEIWCISVNDAFVMGAWAQHAQASHAIRMIADGSADFTRALGLEFDLTARGMGVRSQRYSMIVVDGVVKALNLDSPGKFEVSSAEILLQQARKLSS